MSLTTEDRDWITSAINGAIAGAIKDSETRLKAAIEHVETSLLTAFHKWSSPLEQRVRSHSHTLRAIDLEVEA